MIQFIGGNMKKSDLIWNIEVAILTEQARPYTGYTNDNYFRKTGVRGKDAEISVYKETLEMLKAGKSQKEVREVLRACLMGEQGSWTHLNYALQQIIGWIDR